MGIKFVGKIGDLRNALDALVDAFGGNATLLEVCTRYTN